MARSIPGGRAIARTLIGLFLASLARAAMAATPETVVVTFRPKAGNEVKMEEVIRKEWAALVRLNAVVSDNDLLFKGKDTAGNVVFVHIMTWRDESIPDSAPPEITSLWDEMHVLGTVSFVVVKPLAH